ncbi:MAG: hypothetical protein IJ574_02060 [Bacilli bacterium]|nr:hypothetical protein [Bacilli bacterium]
MKNSEKFIKLLESGKYKKYGVTATERMNAVKDYTAIDEQKDLKNFEKFINSSAYDTIKLVRVRKYK